jgi:hypothetical protein
VTEDSKHNKTDKLFHDAFAEWEVQPASANWDKVEIRLDEDRKRPGAWIWLAGTLLLVGLIAAAVLYLWPKDITPRQYFVNGPLAANASSVTIDSSFTYSLLSKESLADSTLQKIQQQADSINNLNPSTMQSTRGNTITANSSPVSTSAGTSVNATLKSNTPRTSSITSSGGIIAPQQRKTETTANASTSTKPNLAKKDSSNYIPVQKKLQPAVAKEVKQAGISTGVVKNTVSQTTKSSTDTIHGKVTNAAEKPTTVQPSSNKPAKQSNSPTVDSSAIAKVAAKKADSLKTVSAKHIAVPNLFSVSVFYSPEIARIDVTSNNSKFNIQNAVTTLRYSAGARFNIQFGSKFELNIGLSYSQLNQTFALDTTSFSKNISQPFIINTSLGNLSVPAASLLAGLTVAPWINTIHDHYKYTETVDYLNMPINARMNFSAGKLKPYASLGVNLQYEVSESAVLDIIKDKGVDLNETYNNLGGNNLNIGLNANLGIEYAFTKRIGVYLEPNARLNTLALTSGVKSLNYFAGCQGGIRIGL